MLLTPVIVGTAIVQIGRSPGQADTLFTQMSDSSDPTRGQSLDQVKRRPGGRSARTRAQVLRAVHAELLDGGYHALSHRSVARRAGVDPATVYRRWPTRSQLATDALLESAGNVAAVPDTGSLPGDLNEFLQSVVAALNSPGARRLFQAFASIGADDDVGGIVKQFWQRRMSDAVVMIDRSVDRGEVAAGVERNAAIELLVAPVYFRLLVIGEPIDPEFVARGVRNVLVALGYPDP